MTTRAESNWERLVSAALLREELRGSSHDQESFELDTTSAVPPSLVQESNIEAILQAADVVQADDPNVSRILCEYAYSLAQNLDPNSEGRGVLQFKTGLKSVIKQKLSKKEGDKIDRSLDIALLQDFYAYYREKHRIDDLEEQMKQWKESRELSSESTDFELRMEKLRRVLSTLRVLKDVLEALTASASLEKAAATGIPEKLKKVMESDAAKVDEFKAYNILPLEAPAVAEDIMFFPEVKAALSALKFSADLPQLPEDFPKSRYRPLDLFDLLHFIFGFQVDNVSNQREHLLLLLANTQARLNVLQDTETQLDEATINRLSERILQNYSRWCAYLRIPSVFSRAITRQRKMLLMALFLLIWGESANLRFLPECLCYIFHHMVDDLYNILLGQVAQRAKTCSEHVECSFLQNVVTPIYGVITAEAAKNKNGKASHAAWRNYDDLNEFFWSKSCFQLHWPWRTDAPFFLPPSTKRRLAKSDASQSHLIGNRRYGGKTLFVEHRTFFHMFHSFHRLWLFFLLMLQGLTTIAFCRDLHLGNIKKVLSVAPTFLLLNFLQSLLDVMLMFGAYSSTPWNFIARVFIRLFWFGSFTGVLTFLYVKALQEHSQSISNSPFLKLYILILGIYVALQLFVSLLRHIPPFRRLIENAEDWRLVRWLKWAYEEHYYVGRGLYESSLDYLRYLLFWLLVLGAKFSFSYLLMIKPLVEPTRTIIHLKIPRYSWHDFFSKNNHNALTLVSLWAPVVMIYFLDAQVWYTVASALVGGLSGARARLGEIRSLSMLRKRFRSFPKAFVTTLLVKTPLPRTVPPASKDTVDAAKFAPFWNELISNLREEDFISNRERDLLFMPTDIGKVDLVQWPLFLLASKIYLAIDIAVEHEGSQNEMWERILKEDYMSCAVAEIYYSIESILKALVNDEARAWLRSIFIDITKSIEEDSFIVHFNLKKLFSILTSMTTLTGLLIHDETPERSKSVVKVLDDLYEVIMQDFLSSDLREKFESWAVLQNAKYQGRLFRHLSWPQEGEERDRVKRLHYLISIRESAANIPRNLEARRRLEFFTNSLFMKMPNPPLVRKMLSFSVFTPYYSEDVLYSKEQLRDENEDGITILFYLQKIFPDEWKNFLERISLTEAELERQLQQKSIDLLELRLWASYRGQTLARTVRGMMYYRKALLLQSFLDRTDRGDLEEGYIRGSSVQGNQRSKGDRALADLKFTYVVTCQIYGQQKQKRDPRAADINFLLQKNEALRVAYIDIVERLKEGKLYKEFYSKLIKADASGNDQEIYTIKLPGDPKIGEGKPENQNHAIIFTRGDALQTIDMNQDNYFEEAFKMRNLLEEFGENHGLRPPTVLGVRENVFTGSVSSLAWFMSNQETSFVTLGQRVLAHPLKIRMHYGHPDVFDRIFHLTRGGISKASRVINISEDIYAGFNSTLRQGNVTHHEYIQVGKGRDVGLNQIALFEAKVSSGNGEQMLSRDVYRLGQRLDFIRMLSFFYTSVGYYICTMMTVLTVYVFLYGRAYLALSGVEAILIDKAKLQRNSALLAAINTQFLFQIGIFTAVPMIMGFMLEQGVLKAIANFIIMQLQLASVFFTFSLGTKTHYFGRTLLHGGAKYRATGRGFVVRHISFAENYRLYSRSHFVKGLEVAMLLIVYLSYGSSSNGLSYILLTFSSWFLAISWIFAPYIFNPSGFEWQKMVEDFDDWTNWLLYKGGVSVKSEESWEAWWDEEQEHIHSLRGRLLETILSVRFFIFQYGIVYHLKAAGGHTSLTVYGISWLAFLGVIFVFKIFTMDQKATTNIQLFLRLLQGLAFMFIVGGLIAAVAATSLTTGDVFASVLALIPTGWGLLSIAIAWRPMIEFIGLWKSVRAMARLYDAAMGMIVFAPLAFLSWFPFVSTFQTRLVFNQAFSRGLEISLILAGNRPNTST
ncbi:hypothetical protein O6H91_08G015900 [Diphasiastrum complanatum]|uniref:Uncharacterized protein n=1 Tax=Diphasiastrum complanatum TaxID=34168 RepID=A0ACC2CV73_DIPCM|nr:hypothetical protein O6H91_08G015900 [Diphasiastrum complanatum]